MDINEINIEIQHLQRQIDTIDSDYKFYINFILAIITIIVALLGLSAYTYRRKQMNL